MGTNWLLYIDDIQVIHMHFYVEAVCLKIERKKKLYNIKIHLDRKLTLKSDRLGSLKYLKISH